MSSKIKEKIEKLYKKAQSAEEIGSLEEAATFMAKAQELLVQYNLELSDLKLGDDKPEADRRKICVKERHKWSKTDGDWLLRLYNVVSQFNFCRIIHHGGNSISLIGEDHNMDMVEYICSNIVPTIKSLRNKAWKVYEGYEKQNAFKRGYYRGAVAGIQSKLMEQRQADKVKYSGLPGLVVASEKLVNDKVAELFPRLGVRKTRNLSAASGQTQGFKDGKNIQINKGVGSNSKSSSRLLN